MHGTASTTPQRSHEQLFGVGDGFFGESTAIAGDYASDLPAHPRPASARVPPDRPAAEDAK